jgi:GDP-mannose 6-dehydrogenase
LVHCLDMNSSVSVFGLGYVGSVTAACLAARGHRVVGVDLNPLKVEQVEAGKSPVIEPGIGELMLQASRSRLLSATTDAATAVFDTDISLLCVGTPSLRNGKLDLGHLEPVCRSIAEVLRKKQSFHLLVLRSTVLPGTAESLVIPMLESVSGKRFGSDFGVCVNPEFMREGSAVADFLHPCVTVIGAADSRHATQLRCLYDGLGGRVFETSCRSAEMVKYLSNAWHAVKVAFANETGSLARELGVDVESLFDVFYADTRLNLSSSYLKPGFSFGGSCLPKDLRALSYRAKELDLKLPLLNSVLESNEQHFRRALDIVLNSCNRKIALLGLSFKADTDDLRESPQVHLVKQLLAEGRQVTVWDENVVLGRLVASNREYIESTIPHIAALLCESLDDAVMDAEIVILATRAVQRDELLPRLRTDQSVIDLVNFEKSRRPITKGNYEGICW